MGLPEEAGRVATTAHRRIAARTAQGPVCLEAPLGIGARLPLGIGTGAPHGIGVKAPLGIEASGTHSNKAGNPLGIEVCSTNGIGVGAPLGIVASGTHSIVPGGALGIVAEPRPRGGGSRTGGKLWTDTARGAVGEKPELIRGAVGRPARGDWRGERRFNTKGGTRETWELGLGGLTQCACVCVWVCVGIHLQT